MAIRQRVAPGHVPSVYDFRYNSPLLSTSDQWRGVYYAAGLSPRLQRTQQLREKRRFVAAELAFGRQSQEAIAADVSLYRNGPSAGSTSSSPAVHGLLVPATAGTLAARVAHVRRLNGLGLHAYSAQHVDMLHDQRQLASGDYASIIGALRAAEVQTLIRRTTAKDDELKVPKFSADRGGAHRAQLALSLMDRHTAQVAAPCIQHYNALMSVLLSCGFDNVQKVHGVVYDAIGRSRLNPNQHTYELVIRSLALAGNTVEARHLLTFLQHRSPAAVSTHMYDSLMMGHRSARDFDACNALWRELVDRAGTVAGGSSAAPGHSRAGGGPGVGRIHATVAVDTAEQYLRSIFDHAYSTTSPDLNRLGELNGVEKKRVPLVLSEMERLGIPRSHLSPSLLDEVEDALRKYSIPRNNFYQWGRAVKQFDFVNFRRVNGLIHDMKEINPTVLHSPTVRPFGSKPGDALAPRGTEEGPAWLAQRPKWQLPPMDHVLSRNEMAEHMHDTRGSEKYYEERVSIHSRSSSWMSDSPPTRYDKLYGESNPNIPQMGIRKYLLGAGEHHAAREDTMARDAKVMRSALSAGRRLRQRSESHKTHFHGGTD